MSGQQALAIFHTNYQIRRISVTGRNSYHWSADLARERLNAPQGDGPGGLTEPRGGRLRLRGVGP